MGTRQEFGPFAKGVWAQLEKVVEEWRVRGYGGVRAEASLDILGVCGLELSSH